MSHPGQLTMILWQRCLHWTKLEISDSCCCLGRKANSIGEYTTIPVRVPWNLLHNGTERMQGPSSVSSLQITHYSHCLVSSYLLQLWICCCAALIVRCSHTWESPRLTRQDSGGRNVWNGWRSLIDNSSRTHPLTKKEKIGMHTMITVYLLMYIARQTYSLTGFSSISYLPWETWNSPSPNYPTRREPGQGNGHASPQ